MRLEEDAAPTDRYGRVLAWVWSDAGLVNEALVRGGWAVLYTVPPNVKYASRVERAQKEAAHAPRRTLERLRLRLSAQRVSPPRLPGGPLGPLCRGDPAVTWAVTYPESPCPLRVRSRRSRSSLVLAGSALAQRPDSAPSPFRPLALAGAELIRTGSGRPGSRYWQQRADYRIAATLDPARRRAPRPRDDPLRQPLARRAALSLAVRGAEHLRPGRASPSSSTSRRSSSSARPSTSPARDSTAGSRWSAVSVGRRRCTPACTAPPCGSICARPLAPGAAVDLDIAWHFNVPRLRRRPHGPRRHALRDRAVVPPHGGVRRRPGLEPRAVHRRRRVLPGVRQLRRGAHRAGRLHRRAPRARCGTRSVVLTAAQRERLARAAALGHDRSRSSPPQEAGDAGTHPARSAPGTLTWHFTADSVRDFAFAAAPELPLGRERLRRHPGPDALPPDGARSGRRPTGWCAEALQYFSEQWFRYPYPHATTVEGPIEGMEYPDAHLRSPNSPAARSSSGCWPTSSGTSGSR